MVLENSSAVTSSDSFYDDAPVSDNDPYASAEGEVGDGNSQRYHVDISRLPRPIPVLGSFFGYNRELFQRTLDQKVKNLGNRIQRPLTHEEFDAFAYSTAKQISICSYGDPIGVAGGLWRAYGTAATFRFPFWQPNLEKFQTDVFPPKLAVLKGNRAMMAWHALRMVTYGILGLQIGQILFGSYSMTVGAVGELSDPRLKGVMEKLRQETKEKRDALQKKYGMGPRPQQRSQQDEMSSAGGMPGEESAESGSSLSEAGAVSGSLQKEERSAKAWPQASNAPSQPGTHQDSDSGLGAFDDASGQGVKADPMRQQEESAWERLRRGEKLGTAKETDPRASTGPAQPVRQSAWSKLQSETQQEPKKALTMGERLAFLKSVEERDLAKSEAQRQFDAQVERERRGGDFNDTDGDQRRW